MISMRASLNRSLALLVPVVVWAVWLLCFDFASSVLQAADVRCEQSRFAMGTQFSIVAYGGDESRLESAVAAALDEIARIDHKWSDYRRDSDISRVNRLAAEGPVNVDAELFAMLETCLRYSRETSGAFDITVGPLVTAWGFFKGSGCLPEPDKISAALAHVGWQKLLLSPEQRIVSFAMPGMRLDLGAIGKGYAIDSAAAVLRQAGIRSALLIAGGSSILAMGAPPGQLGWAVSVRDPKDAKKIVTEVLLKDASLSTSGNYEKFFRANGRIYSHIFDPLTGYPVQGVLSCTVITNTGTQTDALSTGFFVMGKKRALSYLKKHPGIRVFFCTEAGCEWLRSSSVRNTGFID